MLLSDLLVELDADWFVKENSFVVRGNDACLNDLFSINELNHLINRGDYRFINLRFAKAGNKYLGYYKGWKSTDVFDFNRPKLNFEEVRDILNDGATLIIDDIQVHSHSINLVCERLSLKLGCEVRANLYYSKQNSSSFGAHFDSHDVLIVQLHGGKLWRMHSPTYSFPMKGSKNLPFLRPTDSNFVLAKTEPNSLIFIPLGYWHEAFTQTISSLHISFTFSYPRMIDHILGCVKSWEHVEMLRRPLRSDLNGMEKQAVRSIVEKLLEEDLFKSRPKSSGHLELD